MNVGCGIHLVFGVESGDRRVVMLRIEDLGFSIDGMDRMGYDGRRKNRTSQTVRTGRMSRM